jgi:choline dehydrogenase-like flavoprotein
MAIKTGIFDDTQRATLTTLCDTFVPSLAHDPDPTGFWSRSASDLGVPAYVEDVLSGIPEAAQEQIREFMDGLAALGFPDASPVDRERFIHAFMDSGPEGLAGMMIFKSLTLMFFCGIPDAATGRNPNWEVMGYPGPLSAPPATPKPIRPVQPQGDPAVLDADAVVIGSGAGGGVIAGILAAQGKHVVVLEAGGYYNEADFNQYELWAYQNLYRAGGLSGTADGSVSLMTGSNLGGGTTINWTNCIKTRPSVRQEWARDHGLEGLDGPDFDRHLDAVWTRLGVNDQCSDYNGPHKRLQEACANLGYNFRRVTRNADPSTYDPRSAGFMAFGDQSGSKMGTLKTYLEDAYEHGAEFVVRCRADRVLVEGGRATGVEATYTDASGAQARLVVSAPTVVVAAGALDSPALLLRSGIGGPAVGRYLRLHPGTAVAGVYDEPQQSWWGPPQTGLSDQFADLEEGYGFLIECAPANPGLSAAVIPWASGQEVKNLLQLQPNASPFVILIRDRGHGTVTIDEAGSPVHQYHLEDPLDEGHFRRGLRELVLLHHAAGARKIYSLHARALSWDRDAGDDIADFAQRVHDGSLAPHEHATFSLHHMGSCRMGADPATSVANPWGELHDVKGVWIGDGSAFPTATGTNPMISVMALAHRTAEAIAAAG